jgi:aspartate/methionine/tyrosine aminotransferase
MRELNRRNAFFDALVARPGLVWMGQNTMHHAPHPEVVRAIQESIERHEYQMYAPPLGLDELRELIATDLQLENVEVCVTDGAVSGLYHVCTTVGREVSQIVTTDPGWPWPAAFLAAIGKPARIIDVYSATHGYKLDPEHLREAVDAPSIIYLIDPLNPLGSSYTRAELTVICEIARESRSYLIHDCTYRHFAHSGYLAARLYPERTLTTYSFSKWLGLAGFRVGAIAAAPELIARLASAPPNSLGSNLVAQRGAIAGLRNKAHWIDEIRAINERNQAIVEQAARTCGWGSCVVYPSSGNFVSIDISSSGWTSEALADALLARGVFVRPGTYQSRLHGEAFIKVSTSVPPEWADRLARELRALSTKATAAVEG